MEIRVPHSQTYNKLILIITVFQFYFTQLWYYFISVSILNATQDSNILLLQTCLSSQ